MNREQHQGRPTERKDPLPGGKLLENSSPEELPSAEDREAIKNKARFTVAVVATGIGASLLGALTVVGVALFVHSNGWFGSDVRQEQSEAMVGSTEAPPPEPERASATQEEVTEADNAACAEVSGYLGVNDQTRTDEAAALFIEGQAEAAGSQDLTDLLTQMAKQIRESDYDDMSAFDQYLTFCY